MSVDGVTKPKRQIIVEMTIPKGKFLPIISWLIRLAQWKWLRGQKWKEVPSHVRIKFFDRKHEVWWVYEASQSSLKLIGHDYVSSVTKVVKQYEHYITPEVKHKMVVKMNKESGKPYGKLQLVGLAIVKFFRAFGARIKNPFANKNKQEVCSEAVYWVLGEDECFKKALSKYDPDTIDLCDIIEAMELMKDKECKQ